MRLNLTDARTGESVDASFLGDQLNKAFEVPAGQSTSLFWKITVPDFVGVLTYKIVAANDKLSDGEEGFLAGSVETNPCGRIAAVANTWQTNRNI